MIVLNKVKSYFEGYDDIQQDFGWTEFTLEELGLPTAEEILNGVNQITNEIDLQGWRTKHGTNETYKGFGLTHNPTFVDKTENIHHQVFGSKMLSQVYSQQKGIGDHTQIKDTYYDTFGFRKRDKLIDKHLGFFLDRFNFHVCRSRVGFIFGYGEEPNDDRGWHVDEPTSQLLRINIPLQTSDEYVMQYNNKTYTLETGNAYLWNTKIRHRPTIVRKVTTKEPRINVIVGVTPWLKYDKHSDTYNKNEYFGKPIKEIVDEKLFVKGV